MRVDNNNNGRFECCSTVKLLDKNCIALILHRSANYVNSTVLNLLFLNPRA